MASTILNALRMDILFFPGYNIDEPLPCLPRFREHSTLSRDRTLLFDSVFTETFERVLAICIEAGMGSGHAQAINAAPLKATCQPA